MVRPDQELLTLEKGAEKKTGPDHDQAFSVSHGEGLLGWEEAPAVTAARRDAFVRLLLQETQNVSHRQISPAMGISSGVMVPRAFCVAAGRQSDSLRVSGKEECSAQLGPCIRS